jgi:serine/threonine protein kinase
MLVRMRFFHVDELESSNKSQNQFCIAIDDPILTLSKIIASMDRNKYRNDHERISRYINKLRKVFRMIGEGIYHLHQQGVVHGCIDTDSCGKFEDGWKVLNLIGSQYVGKPISSHRMGTSVPPEAVQITGRTNNISVRAQTSANVSMDIWAFGKLMYEVLSGKQLLPVSGNNSINNNSDINDSHKMVIEEDKAFLRKLRNWNEDNLSFVVAEIEAVGVGTLAADLISHCLCPFPEHRPKNMKEVLAHPYWNELSKNGGQSSIGMRRVSSNGSGASAMKRRFQV